MKSLLPISAGTIFMCLCSHLSFCQEEKGYGLVLPTEEQLKQIPYVPGFSLPPNFVLPNVVSLADSMPPIGDQGYQGSCTAWAVSYAAKTYQERIQTNLRVKENGVPKYDRICSPSYVFNTAKHRTGNANCLDGIHFVEAFYLLTTQGTAFWNAFPYDVTNCTRQPNQSVVQGAAVNKIFTYNRVNITSQSDLQQIKYNLSVGNPIIIGVLLDYFFQPEGFDHFRTNRHYTYIPRGVLPYYHAMVVTGYNNQTSSFQIMNSWGPTWGNKGFLDIPYHVFSTVVQEAYYMIDAPPVAIAAQATTVEADNSQTKVADEKYSSWFKEGYYREFKKLRLGLLSLNETKKTATVKFTDISSGEVISTVLYDLNVPTTFYYKDYKITFVLMKIDKAGKNPLNKAAYFTVSVDETVDKEFIETLNLINFFKSQQELLKSIKINQDLELKKQESVQSN